MATIKDIAKQLGVAPSTVTRALADSPRISLKTRKLVKLTADEMGYIADAAAKTMRSRRSTLIGLLIPDIENNFYAQIAKSFSDVCNREGFQLTLAVSDDDPAIEERHIRELIAVRCAGIAIVPTAGLTAQSVSLLASKNAAQLIRRNPTLNKDWYGIDDIGALRNVTKHLLELGHRRIALICGEEAISSGQDRYNGYISALHDHSIAIDPTLIMKGPPRANFSEVAVTRLMALSDRPSAIIAAGSGLSEGMLNAAATWSQADREAISLIGYSENNAFRWWGDTGLSTIDLPVRQIAADLCLTLLKRARGEEAIHPDTQTHVYGSHLNLRGSVHPLK